MPIPYIRQDVVDGALGLDAGASDYHAKIGICSTGAANVPQIFSDPRAMKEALGTGPLVEAAAYHLAVAKRPVVCVPASQTTAGSLGAITQVGGGPALSNDSSAPLDAYELRIRITLGGALSTARMVYSLDGGDTWSREVLVTASFSLPDTGIALTAAAGTYVVDSTYSADCTAPAYDLTAAVAAVAAVLASGTPVRCIHLIGETTASAGATLTAGLQAAMTDAENAFQYLYVVHDVADSDANLKTSYAAVNAPRVVVCAGKEELASHVTFGRAYRRPASWPFVARVMSTPIHEHPGKVTIGDVPWPLDGVSKLHRDEYLTEGLDEARFTTLRSHVGLPGSYVTRGNTMALLGSDFAPIMNRQVLDLALQTAYRAMLRYLNASLLVAPNGTIDEVEAADMEATVRLKLRAVLLGENAHASAVEFQINKTNNVLTTKTLKYKVRVRPRGYAEFIEGEVGFAGAVSA